MVCHSRRQSRLALFGTFDTRPDEMRISMAKVAAPARPSIPMINATSLKDKRTF